MSCVICGKEFGDDPTVEVRHKGLKTLCKFSDLRNDMLFNFTTDLPLTLHLKCRKKYTKENAKGVYSPLFRSNNIKSESSPSFDFTDFPFKERCFFCTKEIKEGVNNKKNLTCHVTKYSTQITILKKLQRRLCTTNQVILQRIRDIDLVAAKAIYHRKCYLRAINGTRSLKQGRPECPEVSLAMQIIFDYIEKSLNSQFNVREFRDLLSDPSLEGYVPDNRTIVKKLSRKYGDRICIMNGPKGSVVVKLKDSLGNDHIKRLRIVKRAAEIIREDISLKASENGLKNAKQGVLEPQSLNVFLKTVAGVIK